MTSIARRRLVQASAAATLATGLARPALAASGPIKIGWLPALTGPSSSTGIAIGRGVGFGVAELNAAGGIDGRKVELIIRDTQSDPTKAVNAAAELTRSEKVHVIYGPGNSGEALACTAVIARARTPQLNPCFVDEVIDAEKYPLAFRTAPSNQQVGAAANRFVLDILKIREIAVIGDTTGYGTSSVKAFAAMLTAAGASVVYEASIDANQPDLLPDMMRMRNAGAKAIMPWSVNPGFLARLLNTRAAMGWDVPVAGQPTLGSGQTRALLERPENWQKVYQTNFRTCCYGEDGKLPERTAELVARLRKAQVETSDTLLWWIAAGYDIAALVTAAVRHAGEKPEQMAAYWNAAGPFAGVFGHYGWAANQHNGYPDDSVVMSQANSFQNGTFRLAPGYG
ncbi:ABC transporter substrate-binding protein [Roseicella frigidaeris]|uniref:Amino acid ABC transporter substrate-binding protein n=1 Tax=Roseicella frigidaeris TaxID=2230885 RepID=A0A327M6P8_9PROT|nr:ABC transporter substrate-binding protein [Roseicella frigidaeris]RAI57984.1 amino acid ABC transporter substrate-binding protein [Roseicella frigidaeris]